MHATGENLVEAVDSAKRSDPRPDESITLEGLDIASAAARLTLKNQILVEILRGDTGFDEQRFAVRAREILHSLAAESLAEAQRLAKEIRRARRRSRRPSGMHDYRRADVANLEARLAQAEQVAAGLHARVEDRNAVGALVTAAHRAAWSEVARNIQHNLEADAASLREVHGPGDRSARIDEVLQIDLPELADEARRKRNAASRQHRSIPVRARLKRPHDPGGRSSSTLDPASPAASAEESAAESVEQSAQESVANNRPKREVEPAPHSARQGVMRSWRNPFRSTRSDAIGDED